ncbi:hypothetical protein ABOM_006485 [Aspergillus bombycis]|uniref:Ketosynthase family 3 (KS3) domain-containing protein n=1 Tax=Aspergillus bombycis TaxID=109264 RepID=A0A1F8A1G3_9EURO|nr:hypothetical protein ABOM_006485 [Aspergillus bombycis]OGM45562.1 hypothetical protein ABOM_006485 [Aspergillus bombycis]
MGMRLPGGVRSAEDFWEMLIEKKTGHGEIPESRYNAKSFCDPKNPRQIRTRYGYYLQEDPACFDADFFSMSSVEASRVDPQQRLLLEVVWECLENAGETDWRGKNIGCYVGTFGEDWLCLSTKEYQHIDRYYALGTGAFALSNRISYVYDFRGPSMTIQTGCSASLVGEYGHIGKWDVPKLRPDHNNDPIRGVIRGTASNSDGWKSTITAPDVLSQESLMRTAYSNANISDISQTPYFECHGTGTAMGDSVEPSAIARVTKGNSVYIGSVKPNVGHSEGASGITSVIKTV